jgi:outer membrane lipoprotein SlyB
VYIYPTSGQSADQQGRDRYECYLWSVKQTGFDPSQARLAPHQRVEVIPAQAPGSDTVAGAATGAILGAVIANPHNAAAGAIGGAIVGGALGAASDASREAQTKKIQERYDRRSNAQSAQIDEQASNYRRAMTACLEGRGYTVK